MRIALFFILIYSPTVISQSFVSLDPRSMGMGGSGVATAHSYNAFQFNPALLYRSDVLNAEPGFFRTNLGVRLHDREEFLSSLDSYQKQNYEDRLQNSINRFNQQVEQRVLRTNTVRQILTDSRSWLDGLSTLSDKPLRVMANGALNAGFNRENISIGAFSRRTLVLGSRLHIAPADLESTYEVIDFLEFLLEVAEAEEIPAEHQQEIPRLISEAESFAEVRGADYWEQGISIAAPIKSIEDFSIGLNVKFIHVDTFLYQERLQNIDIQAFNRANYQEGDSSVNLDIGFSGKFASTLRWGLVIRNLFHQQYPVKNGESMHFDPIVRAGLAYEHERTTLAVDYDLTRNDPLGYDPDKQFISFGWEQRFWRNIALRAGYRHNLVDHTHLYSFGFGLQIKRLTWDLAFAQRGDENGVSTQLVIHF